MLKKIKNIAMVFALVGAFSAPAFAVASVSANNITQNLCAGTNIAANNNDNSTCATGQNGRATIGTIATTIVNYVSLIVGIIAVLMIVYGGFKYITSGGESSNVSGAKNTLIYAIVGLIIVALAQFIVRFVLDTTTGFTTGT